MTKTVFVTGASGYIAAHIVEQLLVTTTYTVRGSVRSVSSTSKIAHLTSLPHATERLQLVEADLTTEGVFDELVKGCDAVIHTASPYSLNVEDVQRDLVDPAEQGTLNVLRAVVKADTVETVVLTSSMAAITDEPVPGHVFSEADWNGKSNLNRNPYHYSKVRAEKAAWNFMEKDENRDKFRLVVINPHVVIGPSHTKAVNTSLLIIQEILTGKFPGIIDINFGFVDVRDVAKAHILAMENPDARGRYVCFAEPKHVKQVIEVLKREFPGYSYPWLNIPNMIVYLASYLEGQGRGSFMRTNVGKGAFEINNSKIKKELGIEFMSIDTSIIDSVRDLQRWGNIPAEKKRN
ncbi:NAD-dependent epimerase/dehydratase:3-beta hydroxysteroid dehydrogenase/isomerase [Endogone sp. FLAS-F59071]|nr:NAD-dependent epimerase/dehydratase:3-beta hydroxysteroid dehydrogenase/isomerase [Endogone sp. FLAS-F59071]|eukprot:RUS15684.1 NAD-dependent epimerase/dehydratase:3-beta hydroxysteroid dehydrogenase/isomerase [Endogone sp. FLAS-F59071]